MSTSWKRSQLVRSLWILEKVFFQLDYGQFRLNMPQGGGDAFLKVDNSIMRLLNTRLHSSAKICTDALHGFNRNRPIDAPLWRFRFVLIYSRMLNSACASVLAHVTLSNTILKSQVPFSIFPVEVQLKVEFKDCKVHG